MQTYVLNKTEEFFTGIYPVTADMWNCIVMKSHSLGYEISFTPARGDFPAGNITWFDCVKFCNAASEINGLTPVYKVDGGVYRKGCFSAVDINKKADGVRLPSEHEWERACRAGTDTKYYWGDNIDERYMILNYAAAENVNTRPSGERLPNPFGLYDMSGNVYEWCFDSKAYLKPLRGGSVALDSECGSGSRSFSYPDYQCYETGLRLVCDKETAISYEIPENVPAPDFSADYSTEKFFNEINLDLPALKDVKKYVQNGDYETALKNFRKYYIKKLAEDKVEHHPNWAYVPASDEQMKRLMDSEETRWFVTQNHKDIVTRAGNIYSLYYIWKETGDIKYAAKLAEYMNHKALHYKEEFDNLTPEELNADGSYSRPQAWDCYMGFHKEELEMLQYISMLIKDGAAEVIDAETLKNILMSCLKVNVRIVVKDPRSTIGNQMMFTNMILIETGVMMNEFKDAAMWVSSAMERVENLWLAKSCHPDGTDTEQGINYNIFAVRDYAEMKELIKGSDFAPPKKTEELIKYRKRMVYSLKLPFGGNPASGQTAPYLPPLINENTEKVVNNGIREEKEIFGGIEDEISEYIMDTLAGDADGSRLGFTSVAFPYGGYYLQRENWSKTSLYMCMFAPRMGMGHCAENCNAIQLAAYGRQFFTNAGADSYKNILFIPRDQAEYIDDIDKYGKSTFGWTDVCADGMSQSRYLNGDCAEKAYDTVTENKWYTSEDIEYMEGVYKDGYGETKIPIIHRRCVFFLKKHKLWVLVDFMNAEGRHKYNQVWHIPSKITHEFTEYNHKKCEPFDTQDTYNYEIAGFDDCEIETEAHVMRTRQKNAPNIAVYHAAGATVSYERHRGELNPARGWLAPGYTARRFFKTDIHACWTAIGNSRIAAIIAPSPNEDEIVTKLECAENSFEAETADGKICFAFDEYNGIKAEMILETEESTVIIDGEASRKISKHNGEIEKIEIPESFGWECGKKYSVTYRVKK